MEHVVLTQSQVNTLYDMFSHLVMILNKYGIEWVATDGTLLGAIRDGGFIPWDDDIDIAIKKTSFNLLKHLEFIITKANTYKLVRVGKYAKLKYDDLWIDIFLLDDEWGFPQNHFKNLSFREGEVYPIRKVMFGDIEINIPHKSEEYLHRILPEWDKYAIIYNHKSKSKIKMSFKDHPELLKPFLPDN